MSRAWLGLAALLAIAGCPAPGSPDAADRAPAFRLEALEGAPVALEELRGRVVVLDFWATWCAPCVFQIPVLNEFWERHRDGPVSVLGISVDFGGPGVVAEFAEEHAIRYPVLLGDEDLAQRYGAIGYPTLYVIAPDGRIDSQHVGVVSAEELEAAVRRAGEAG